MKKPEVMALLEENQNERGIENWNARAAGKTGLKSYGIGLTQLRKLAKHIGRDHELAAQLWKSKVYDAKVVGLLIDDPKKMTREPSPTSSPPAARPFPRRRSLSNSRATGGRAKTRAAAASRGA